RTSSDKPQCDLAREAVQPVRERRLPRCRLDNERRGCVRCNDWFAPRRRRLAARADRRLVFAFDRLHVLQRLATDGDVALARCDRTLLLEPPLRSRPNWDSLAGVRIDVER